MKLTEKEQKRLLGVATDAVRAAACGEKPHPWDLANESPPLRHNQASFVTLKKNGDLRGCIGTLEAYRPLLEDVAANARAAALNDPRFPAVGEGELEEITLSLSLLSPPEPFVVRDEADLLARLQPGVDGLVLAYGHHRATFLPAVWEQLPTAEEFFAHLKMKAGLRRDFWHDAMQFQRYRCDAIE